MGPSARATPPANRPSGVKKTPANVQRHRQESRERIFSDRELTQLFMYLSFTESEA